MKEYTVTDEFGRRTVFNGEKLVAESTDHLDGRKPQWTDIDVWRTAAGSFIVKRAFHYRVRHIDESCPRALGYELIEPTELDTFPCGTCNKSGATNGGWAQADRISVDVYDTPQKIIDSFAQDGGRYSSLARIVLGDLAEQDSRIDDAWNTVVVP